MRSVLLIITTLLVACTTAIYAAQDEAPLWTSPMATAIKRVSDVSETRHDPVLFSNIDCTSITYRMVGGHDMRNGCFTPTAFGSIDSDAGVVIFNGTDEGLPLLTPATGQVLAPWPKALNLLTFSSSANGGSYLSMYDDPVEVMQDQRNLLGQLTAKKLTVAPEHTLHDVDGRPLIVHPQATAFSDNGSWMVVETIYGYFARINLASLQVLPFAPAFNSWGGSEPQDARVTVSDDGRFVAVENGQYPSFKVYDLDNCTSRTCSSHEYWPFISDRIPRLRAISHLRFVNTGLLSFEIPSGGSAISGVYELAPEASIDHLTDYIGLGDSYTSGEGAFDYLTGTDTADNTCHLSSHSYPLLLTADLYGAASGHSVACSGAIIDDVGSSSDSYKGQVQHGFNLAELKSDRSARYNEILSGYQPGYVPQELFVKQYQPQVVTVSVGGNDIGFGDILQKCVTPHLSRHLSDETCYDTYESREEVIDLVKRTVPRWTALYRQLKSASPGATVYAIGYPSVISDTGKCPLSVGLAKGELEFAEELIHYLDDSIKEASEAAGVNYVDISKALLGHRLCEAQNGAAAVNGLTAGNDFGVLGVGLLGRESYHPNALGHELIEQAILRGTDNLAVRPIEEPATRSTPDTESLTSNVPKTGRTIYRLMPDKLADHIILPNHSVKLHINGVRNGLVPSNIYEVYLDGAAGRLLGRLPSNMDSSVEGSVVIPADVTAGIHEIDVIGVGQDGQNIEVTQLVYIPGIPALGGQKSAQPTKKIGVTISTSAKNPTDRIKSSSDGWPQDLQDHSPKPMRPSPVNHILRAKSTLPIQIKNRQYMVAVLVLSVLAIAGLLVHYWSQIIKFCSKVFGQALNNMSKMDYEKLLGCFTIVIMRTFGVVVFSVVLFASLLIFAFSTSSNIAFTNPKKLEKWLGDSNLYGAFVENAIDQAEQTAGTDQSGGVSLSDTVVKQAAQQSFSSNALQKDVNIFLASNYAWLNGTTDKPVFSIDLSGAKQDFAARVGKYVAAYLKNLPACTPTQTAKIDPQSADPLTLDCRPAGVIPAKVGAQTTQQIANSSQFLSDPVLTANNIDPSNTGNSMQPYYQRFSALPGVYQKATKIPFVTGLVALLSVAAVILMSKRKRKGLKVTALVFVIAGLVMVSTETISDHIFHSIEKHTFNASTVGQLQRSLTVFFNHMESQLVKVDLWFGIGYLILALGLVLALIATRPKGLRMPKRLQAILPAAGSQSTTQSEPASASADTTTISDKAAPSPLTPAKPSRRPTSTSSNSTPVLKPKPRRPKPPRLVQ